jgi:hypothetical protein
VTVEYSFLQNNFDNTQSISISYPNSLTNRFICQICGYNLENIFEYTNLFLYNVTQQSIYLIQKISPLGLCELVKPMNDYHINDSFEIRSNNFFLQYQLNTYFFSIINYSFYVHNEYQYERNMYVYIQSSNVGYTQQIYKIIDVTSTGQITDMEIVNYGGPYNVNDICAIIPLNEIYDVNNNYSTLIVRSVSFVIETSSNEVIPNNQTNVIYFIQLEFIFFEYTIDKNYIIFNNDIGDGYFELIIDNTTTTYLYGFLKKINLTCDMNVANSSFPQNQLCLNMKIQSLILPNLYVRGYNELLSFFPYVILKIYNVDSSFNSKFGNIITNDKHSMNSQFICPIGNLLNPEIIKFVEIKSDMEQSLKFNPSQDIHFEIRLPNGELLEFDDFYNNQVADLTKLYDYTVKRTIACSIQLYY